MEPKAWEQHLANLANPFGFHHNEIQERATCTGYSFATITPCFQSPRDTTQLRSLIKTNEETIPLGFKIQYVKRKGGKMHATIFFQGQENAPSTSSKNLLQSAKFDFLPYSDAIISPGLHN